MVFSWDHVVTKVDSRRFCLHSSWKEERDQSVVLEDWLENVEIDTFATLYNQVRTRQPGRGPALLRARVLTCGPGGVTAGPGQLLSGLLTSAWHQASRQRTFPSGPGAATVMVLLSLFSETRQAPRRVSSSLTDASLTCTEGAPPGTKLATEIRFHSL